MLLISFHANAQFGIPKARKISTDVPLEKSDQLTTLTEEDAKNIAVLIDAAKEDPESVNLIKSMKEENLEDLQELQKLPQEDVLNAMKMTLDEVMALDYLFADKERAFHEMDKDGMIAEEHRKKYRENPQLLEDDTRRGLYFQFLSLAVVAGYL